MRPPVFRALSFEAAQAAAQAEKKWLLVDFTADWCPPCHHMDATTWRDPAVEKWLTDRTVPIQLDVDKDPTGEKLGVRSMPTVIVFDGDRELDRTSGARAAPKLIEWLEALAKGLTELDSLRVEAQTDLHARLHLSRVLHGIGKPDDAATEALWLWDHALEVEPSWRGVRLSFLIAHLTELVASSRTAKAEVTIRRDALATKVRGTPTADEISDFIALGSALGDTEATLRWFDAVKARAAELGLADHNPLRRFLEDNQRWADLSALNPRPLDRVEEAYERMTHMLETSHEGMPPEFIEETRKWMKESFRKDIATLCRVLEATGRSEELGQVRARAQELDPELTSQLKN
jgi:thiol-disulfide isomerase/thioredoxin